MKNLLFLTTANLSTNPRLYKEITLAEKLGYKTTFIAFRQGGWSDEKDKLLIGDMKAEVHYLSALRSPYWPWLFGSTLNLLCRWLWPVLKRNLWLTAIAHNKRTFHILRFLRVLTGKYDLVIGHNLGALYPAFVYAARKGIPFAFDVEDYHPGESSAAEFEGEKKRREFLMSSLLPHAAYYSYASPMIGQHTSDLMHPSLFARRLLINNCFSRAAFKPPQALTGKLKMVWFSQNIAGNRGLEQIIPVLSSHRERISLTLIGSLNRDFFEKWIEPNQDFIQLHEPLGLSQLLSFLGNFDIGLAVEPGKDDNNLLALSNKIWSYLQAGLFILATDTPAQRLFMSEHPSHGLLVKRVDSMHDAIEEVLSNGDQIRKDAFYRHATAQEFSWETESKKLMMMWSEVLTKPVPALV